MSWFWVIVIAFFVIRALTSMNKKPSTQGNRSQLRQQARDQQKSASGSSWPFGGSGPDIAPMGQPNPAWTPAVPPAPPPPLASLAWQDRLAAEMEAQISSLTEYGEPPAASAPPQGRPIVGQLPEPTAPASVTAAVTAAVTAEPAPSPSSPLPSLTHDRNDIGSAALESTLDSTIESSLFGVSPGPITESVLPGAATVRLPTEIEAAVATFMEAGQEVGAVRFLCDELDMGILDALRAAREVASLPIS